MKFRRRPYSLTSIVRMILQEARTEKFTSVLIPADLDFMTYVLLQTIKSVCLPPKILGVGQKSDVFSLLNLPKRYVTCYSWMSSSKRFQVQFMNQIVN